MPRPKSPPRLWLDEARQTWTIIDGGKRIRTGCGACELQSAAKSLQDYIADTHIVTHGSNPLISDVLKAYSDEHLAYTVSAASVSYDMDRLEEWWGAKRAAEVTAENCRLYIEHRDAPTICRRELGMFHAALMHWHKHREHGPLGVMPIIVKPPASDPRTRWMTRTEAAKFIWHGIRKMPLGRRKRLFRFFIIGWYTGTRHAAIGGISWKMVDLESRIMQRRPEGVAETRKKRPPVKIGRRLLSHLRRWRRLDGPNAKYVIEYGGKPCSDLGTAWDMARDMPGSIPDVTPHTLRHSRATHLMRQGVDVWEASKSLGMSAEMLERVYGHHRPDWQENAAEAR
ncbi:hypothetical protein CWO91_16895 [Bradyrhizobium genosp. SA-3]|uniref:tyrosine-type recombinase/integrase n=1 Tax=Bradyrhizobium genosp. SA-3 TaxID=508868 RepID=UPI001029C76C|nr:tyrosine-type recombinase/integrase [Bradyrhizobium genosp. SA-3]RZN09706.1 hypothetical protein CWO91_16895 [Bradyrhizobium genosp. SA-3]